MLQLSPWSHRSPTAGLLRSAPAALALLALAALAGCPGDNPSAYVDSGSNVPAGDGQASGLDGGSAPDSAAPGADGAPRTDGQRPDSKSAPDAAAPAKVTRYHPLFLKRWPTSLGNNYRQWTSPIVVNPSSRAATMTLTVYGTGGKQLATITRTLAAGGQWNAYGDKDWLAIPDTSASQGGAIGWLEISAPVTLASLDRMTIRNGGAHDSPLVTFDDQPAWQSPIKRARVPLFLKRWPSSITGHTQWTAPLLVNPNASAATVTLTVYSASGAVLSTIKKTIGARSQWNAYGDSDWNAIPNTSSNGAHGWVDVSATQPIIGLSRLAIRNGSAYDSPLTHFEDMPLVATAATTLRHALVLKRWPSSVGGATQWTTPMLVNPGASAATATLTVYRADGTVLSQIKKTIAARAAWNAYGDADWNALPDTSSKGTLGWLAVSATQPLVGFNRLALRSGTTYNAPLEQFDDQLLVSATKKTAHHPLFVKGWSTTLTGHTQWTTPILVNPGGSATTLTLTLHRSDGTVLTRINKSIAARAVWNAYGDAAWNAIPATHSSSGGAVGWLSISASQPIFGLNRLTIRNGTTYNAPLTHLDDHPL